MIKGIIFDLDGTTLDTLLDLHNCINLALKEFNYPTRSVQEVREFVGRGFRNLVSRCLPENVDDQTIDTVLKRYKEIYYQNPMTYTKPYDGMVEVINKLNEQNILIGINSNKNDDLTNELVKHYYPGNKFVKVIGTRDNIPLKPDPYSANEILNLMNISKQEALYIGDSSIDLQTANNLQVKFIGCAWGFRGKQSLIEAGAEIIIDKPSQILEHVK